MAFFLPGAVPETLPTAPWPRRPSIILEAVLSAIVNRESIRKIRYRSPKLGPDLRASEASQTDPSALGKSSESTENRVPFRCPRVDVHSLRSE